MAPQLDIDQILLEAQHRWLRPAEICEILRNFQKFRIASEPPNKPPSGSLYLFDRKVLRYFRKDGHNWRKKRDGKTVKEAHERLKAESIDVLHCYYAHGEENENFQRRSYWLLDENFMHIVLVHYLDVRGNKASFSRAKDAQEILHAAQTSNHVSSNSFSNQSPHSQTTDAESRSGTHISEYEDAESDNYQRSSRYYPYLELQQYDEGRVMDVRVANPGVAGSSLSNPSDSCSVATTSESDLFPVAHESIPKFFNDSGLGLTLSESSFQVDVTPWNDDLGSFTSGYEDMYFQSSLATEAAKVEGTRLGSLGLSEPYADELRINPINTSNAEGEAQGQLSNFEDRSVDVSIIGGNSNYLSLLKQKSLDFSNKEEEGLKKYDSFTRWMSSELDVGEPNMKASSETIWNSVESGSVLEGSCISNQDQLETFLISPSLSQDQLFSINDFSPNWAYSGLETEINVTGTFLKNRNEVEHHKWSCMFGEVEVPAEILADDRLRCDRLRCYVQLHRIGRVPFYVTCSNRLACSEVREFEFRSRENVESLDSAKKENETDLHVRLEKLLCLESVDHLKPMSCSRGKPHLSYQSTLFMESDDDQFGNMMKLTHGKEPSLDYGKDRLSQELLKEKLQACILHEYADDGKGPSILDSCGQGVIHLAAALGYDWAIKPIVTAGVSINFRDVHGWTALHWAASCGRERTVVYLVTLGASPGVLTDPTPVFPSGRTPADLASGNGHKGIAGFLAESSLTTHLSTLTLKDFRGIDAAEVSGVNEDIVERSASVIEDGDMQGGLSLKDSLSAIRNATQAAARIHQVFRVQSFQRKKLIEYADEKFGVADDNALSLVSVKSSKPRQQDLPAQVAAIRIQNKFRGWKGRKDFLIIRQRIIKIQAHVRGHQARKRCRNIIWSVGIVEKAILRWRRKGCGLRGFRPEGLLEGSTMQTNPPSEEENHDFLKEGRRQTEARFDKALARVKSMVQYPEARDQYRRLLTIVTELQESKVMQEDTPNESGADGDFMIELQDFLEDDMLIPNA